MRIVIIGGPGQGKSTLGQQIAQLYRAIWLDKLYEFEDNVEVKHIPFRVVLKYFAQWLGNKTADDNSLEAYLAEEVSRVTLRPGDISPQNIQDIFLCQECLLILDGLDEVVDSKLQQQMLERIYSFLDWAENLNVNLKVVATSRPNIYQEQFDPKRFYHFELLPLSPSKVKEYADKWVATRDLREEEQERILRTLVECQQDERISSLLKTPLQVTIILLIIKNGEIPAKLLWTIIDNRWMLDAVIIKQVRQLLELIIDNYSEYSEFPVPSISVALFLKLLIYDTQIEEIAYRLFSTLPPVKILEIRRPLLRREAVVESDSKFIHTMQSLLAHEEETVRVGIALVLKLIIDSENQRQYSRKYIFKELKNIRIDFNLGMSFINHKNSKYRLVGITLLTLSDYPVDEIKYRNLILDNLKQPQTDEEEEVWYQFLQEIYMPEEKYTMWRRLLEGILGKSSFYNSSILSVAMERYQEISSSIDVTILELTH